MSDKDRVLIVCDGEVWFARRVAYSVEDAARGEMIYHCDKHLGGPFDKPEQALAHLRAAKQDPNWPSIAQAAVASVARRLDKFTTDDVWEELADDGALPGDPRAIGPVMDRAAAAGLCSKLDEHVRSKRRECHGRPVRVWISHVRKGQQRK